MSVHMEYERQAFLYHVQIYPHSTMDDNRSTENRNLIGGVSYFKTENRLVDLLDYGSGHILDHLS